MRRYNNRRRVSEQKLLRALAFLGRLTPLRDKLARCRSAELLARAPLYNIAAIIFATYYSRKLFSRFTRRSRTNFYAAQSLCVFAARSLIIVLYDIRQAILPR